MKHLINILLISLITSSITFAQGLNNDFKYDQEDIAWLFELNDAVVYKFELPYSKKSSNQFNFILHQYKDGKLSDSFNYKSLVALQAINIQEKGLMSDTMTFNSLDDLPEGIDLSGLLDSLSLGNVGGNVRIIIDTVTKENLDNIPNQDQIVKEATILHSSILTAEAKGKNLLRIYVKFLENKVKLDFSLNNVSLTATADFEQRIHGSRAMTKSLKNITKRTRVLTIYGTSTQATLHCAMDDTNEQLSKRMDEVIVLYIEPM